MKFKLTSLALLFFIVFSLRAQEKDRVLPAESAVTSTGQVTIKGKPVPYKVTAGTQPVWDKDGKVIASLFYTYYERTDVTEKSKRPFVMSFNGGPGSASVWMHLAYTGPKMLVIDNEGFPVQPYGVRDNPHSILDVADIVFIDPVNTGFSRILEPKTEKSVFFGVNADISYLADWLDVFVSRVGRWTSAKYLIGESYGTTRVSGLALELQNRHWMYLNGVILVSPTVLHGCSVVSESTASRLATKRSWRNTARIRSLYR
jgi:carboxypeptidase C (cathepsin A)